MKPIPRSLLPGALVVLLSACGGGEDAPSAPAAGQREFAASATNLLMQSSLPPAGTGFVDDMLAFDTARWFASDWNNGGYFLNGWDPSQLSFAGGQLQIALQADTRNLTGGLPAVSGEYRTWDTYGYGSYSARLRASSTPGTISAFFLYTGAAEGARHDEIDVEIKGDDPTRLSVNYWTDGVEHPTVIDLGFDASAAFHDYAFRWTPTGLQWLVDGRLVHEESGGRGPLPQVPGHLVLSLWGATGAQPWSSNYQVSATPSIAAFDSVAFTPNSQPAAVFVHLADLAGRAAGVAGGWRATATATVRDASGAPVPNAVVAGSFSLGGGPFSCTTDAAGVCTVTSGTISKSKGSTTFTVSGISGPSIAYQAAMNRTSSVAIARP